MNRAPFVIAGTLAGLVGIVGFRSSPAKIVLSAPAPSPSAPGSASGPAAGPSVVTSATGVRSATGPQVNYYFGVLSVTVTADGSKITKVSIGSISDGGNPYSQYVDHASIPLLEQQALAAQSANIQGVSGASYTSAGFAQSLQGALSALKLK